MLPTVADVLRLDVLKAGDLKLAAGATGLSNRVRWAHVSELADIAHLLRGGELVLTTGVVLPDTRDGLERYVNELLTVGASGLVVELGRRYTSALPSGLRSAAEAGGLPLIELHRETSFVQVTEAIYSLILGTQLRELRSAEQIHQIFTELSTDGAAPDQILQEAARLSGFPVVLENLAHQVLAFDPANVAPSDLLHRWEDRSRAIPLADTRTRFDLPSGWLVTTVGARGRDWGRLVLVTADDPGPLAPRMHMLIERAASALALSRLITRAQESLERQTHRTLLTGILDHSWPLSEAALRARTLGVPLEGRRVVGVVTRLRDGSIEPTVDDEQRIGRQDRARWVSETMSTVAKGEGIAALVGALDDKSVGALFTSNMTEDIEAALDRIIATVRRAVGAESSRRPIVVGVGSIATTSAAGARRSLTEAMRVAEAAVSIPVRDRHYYRLPDLGIRGLLYLLRSEPHLQSYAENVLGSLLTYDARHCTTLAKTMLVYLECGGNKSAAAAVLGLSRPSLYERLSKSERLLGVDLDDADTRLAMHLALLAFEVIREYE